ncbi:MAG: ribosome maturation factor RimP [Pseudomonadota bacterium]
MLAKTPMDEKIAAIIAPTVDSLGFQLVRVRLSAARTPTLQVMAERPDGTMEVDDCATLSQSLSAVLDVEDPIAREYVLEVSSPGIDRPLTRLTDFERYQGWEAKLETRDLIDGRKRFRGILKGVASAMAGREEDGVRVALDGGEVSLPFEQLVDAKLVLTDALIAESLKGGGATIAPDAEDGSAAPGGPRTDDAEP